MLESSSPLKGAPPEINRRIKVRQLGVGSLKTHLEDKETLNLLRSSLKSLIGQILQL